MRAFFFVVSLLLASGSCSRKESGSGSSREVPIPQEEIDVILENQNFACAAINGGPCPSGIARLFIVDPVNEEESHVCTGFMIDQDTLVTNKHCVATQAECENTHVAVYDGGPYFRTRCLKLVRSHIDFEDVNDPRRAVDYAILDLEGSFSGESFVLAKDGPSPGERISTWVVDHTGIDLGTGLFDSRITEFDCRVLDEEESASLVLEQCPVVEGNSGAPALNSRSEVVGIIWGTTAIGFGSEEDLEQRRLLDEYALATEVSHLKAN